MSIDVAVVSVVANACLTLCSAIIPLISARLNARTESKSKALDMRRADLHGAVADLCENYARMRSNDSGDAVWKMASAAYRIQALIPDQELHNNLNSLLQSTAQYRCTTCESDDHLSAVLLSLSRPDTAAE